MYSTYEMFEEHFTTYSVRYIVYRTPYRIPDGVCMYKLSYVVNSLALFKINLHELHARSRQNHSRLL